MALSASYDVDIAIEYGLPAAALLNKLVYLCRHTPREDGWCWRTAQELQDEIGIGPKALRNAISTLSKAGIIEAKNTYVMNTQTKCRHFFITDFGYEMLHGGKCDCAERDKSEVAERDKSLIHIYKNNQIGIINNTDLPQADIKNAFDAIWKKYPNKQGKQSAFKAFEKAIADGVSAAEIESGVERYAEWCRATGQEKRFIKHGSTWFSQRCWEDELPDPSEFERRNGGMLADAPSEGGEGWLNEVDLSAWGLQ